MKVHFLKVNPKKAGTAYNTAFTQRADALGRRCEFEEVVAATTPYGSS
jgi:hypothetical protein